MRRAIHDLTVSFWMLLLLTGPASVSFAQESMDIPKSALPRFHKVNDGLYRGGMPKKEGFRFLKKMGVKTVVNFRNDNDEQALVENLGMQYVHLPMTAAWGISDYSIQEFFKIAGNPESQPVFVHCQRGADRTGAMIAFYRIAFDNWGPERAYREARDIGLHWLYKNLKKRILEFDPGPFDELIPKK